MLGFCCCHAQTVDPGDPESWPNLTITGLFSSNADKPHFVNGGTVSTSWPMHLTYYNTTLPPNTVGESFTASVMITLSTRVNTSAIARMSYASIVNSEATAISAAGNYEWEIWGVKPGVNVADVVYPNDLLGPVVSWNLSLPAIPSPVPNGQGHQMPDSPDVSSLINAVVDHPAYATPANPLRFVRLYVRPKSHPVYNPAPLPPWYRAGVVWRVVNVDVIEE